MALVKPITLKINAWDANFDKALTFVSIGGNQVAKNKLIVRNNLTNEIVYENIATTYKFENIIPKYTLKNGTYYNYYFITYDIDGNESPQSNVSTFYCYTTPTLVISNIPIGGVIESSNFNFEIIYSQPENELLDTLQVILYDEGENRLASSGNLYSINTPPIKFYHTFNGFKDNASYKLKITCLTLNGTTVESQFYSFSANYFYPSYFSKLDLSNNCIGGYIEGYNNMVLIDGISNPNPPIYIEGEKIDLTGDEHYVKWIDGYNIANDFKLGLWFEKPNIGEDKILCKLWNNSDTPNNKYRIEINLIKDYPYGTETSKTRAVLTCCSGKEHRYYTCSDFINNPSDTDKLFIWVRKSNNLFSIKTEVLT